MEKQKKIKTTKTINGYFVTGVDLKSALYNILPEKYSWIKNTDDNQQVYLSDASIKELNELWKNRKKQ